MEGNMVYLDYAATTPYNKDVLKTYTQLLEKYFYNADRPFCAKSRSW